MAQRHETKVRWRAPDGRVGHWLKTVGGVVKSAVNARYSAPENGVSCRFCIRSALALWPNLRAEGWSIEKMGKRVK